MTKKTTLIAVLALCGALSQSCQMSPNEPPGVDSKQFQDYVVPSGFRLKDRKHESYAREVASWRHGHYVYSGSSKVAAAASYVEANMGRHSWRLVTNEEVDEKSKRLLTSQPHLLGSYQRPCTLALWLPACCSSVFGLLVTWFVCALRPLTVLEMWVVCTS